MNFDEQSFYVEHGIGNRYHCKHKKLNNDLVFKTLKMLNEEANKSIKVMNSGQVNEAAMQHALFVQTGNLVTRSAIRYIKSSIRNNLT